MATPAAIERFAHEIEVTASLHHPNLVSLLDADERFGRPYYTMPFMRNGSLRDRLRREGSLDPAGAVDTVCAAAEGLSHAHALGVVHRDVKPGNVLLSPRDSVVADFGIALSDRWPEDDGEICTTAGTPNYMSPEQIDGREASVCSDIYSLGCMLFELLSGRRPFAAATVCATMLRHRRERPPTLAAVDPSLARYDRVVQRAMAKQPADRFQTCAALIEALRGA